MRNTPHPRHTLGKTSHAIFPVDAKQGLVQGITKISKQGESTASEISDMKHLAVGEKVTFDAPDAIEVLEFGGYSTRGGGFLSNLTRHRIELEKGAVLTGPLAWRTIPEGEVAPKPKDVMSNFEAYCGLGIIILILVAMAFISTEGFFVLLGVYIFFTGVILAFSFFDSSKEKSIANLGSVYVLSPKERHWT